MVAFFYKIQLKVRVKRCMYYNNRHPSARYNYTLLSVNTLFLWGQSKLSI